MRRTFKRLIMDSMINPELKDLIITVLVAVVSFVAGLFKKKANQMNNSDTAP